MSFSHDPTPKKTKKNKVKGVGRRSQVVGAFPK
jgi:hypothetical protein